MNDTPNISYGNTNAPQAKLEGVVYPDPGRLKRYLDDGILTRETLSQAFSASFKKHADRLALVGPEGNFTYRELDENTDRLAAALLDLGLKPLDRAFIQCGNSNELLFFFFACLKATLIPICALQAFRKLEVGYLGNLSEARVHFVQGDDPKFDDVAFAAEMQAEVPSMQIIVQARGEQRGNANLLNDLIASMPIERARTILSAVPYDPFQAAVFQLSGGTTGVPKIIPRLQNEYLYNMRAVAAWNKYSKDDTLFMPTPFMHNMNMVCFFGPIMLQGGKVTVCPDINAETLQQVVREHSPTWYGLAGPIFARVMPALKEADAALQARRTFIAPKNAPRIRDATNSFVCHIFGMTEGVIMFTRSDDPSEVLDLSVGRPVCSDDEVKIVEPGTETEVADGEEGEALFRGPYTISGYYKSEENNRDKFTSDGFYRSGDLMLARIIDGKRYFFFRGRLKDVVDRGGEKINAEELENVINRHPVVLASAVVGMPDSTYGERVCAYIVPKQPGTGLDVKELAAFLEAEGLAKFKWPERVEIIPEFPLTASGKLSKVILRQVITQKLAQERA